MIASYSKVYFLLSLEGNKICSNQFPPKVKGHGFESFFLKIKFSMFFICEKRQSASSLIDKSGAYHYRQNRSFVFYSFWSGEPFEKQSPQYNMNVDRQTWFCRAKPQERESPKILQRYTFIKFVEHGNQICSNQFPPKVKVHRIRNRIILPQNEALNAFSLRHASLRAPPSPDA